MNRPDHTRLAQAARSLQHVARLKSLYSVAPPPDPDAARLRAELVDAASFAGPAASALSTAEQCEQYITRLRGLARLALQLRDALAKGGRNDP